MLNQSAKIDSSRLKEMSDTAALLYIEHNVSLSKAVFHVIREKDVTSEHIKRVLRAANVRAYLMEYDRADPTNRVINFEGGLADYGDIMALYDKGEEKPMPVDSLHDYTSPPEDRSLKKELEALDVPTPLEVKKTADLGSLYLSVNGAIGKVEGELVGLEEKRAFLASEFYSLTKQAILSEHTLGDITRAVSSIDDKDLTGFLVKTAKAMEGTFWTDEEIIASMEKVSMAKVDFTNPLRVKWNELTEVVKTAEIKVKARDLLKIKRAEILDRIKEQEGVK